MKNILFALLFICMNVATYAQTISTFPSSITSDVTAESSVISASGLTPSSGTLAVNPPVKFLVSLDGSSWNYSLSINYTSGSLPATTLYVMYGGPTGLGNTGDVNISGGGASANICVCANMSSCPCSTTGVSVVANNTMSVISPNPVFDVLNISSTSNIASICIINLTGNVVYAHEYHSDNAQVDVSAFPAGVYFVKINGVEVRKFVKE